MDKYTKFILTVIAVAMIGILFKGEINKPSHAADPVGWQSVCVGGYTFVMTNSGGVAQVMRHSRNFTKGIYLPAEC